MIWSCFAMKMSMYSSNVLGVCLLAMVVSEYLLPRHHGSNRLNNLRHRNWAISSGLVVSVLIGVCCHD